MSNMWVVERQQGTARLYLYRYFGIKWTPDLDKATKYSSKAIAHDERATHPELKDTHLREVRPSWRTV